MAINLTVTGYHDQALTFSGGGGITLGHWDTKFTYTFENFFHPFVGELIARLNRHSLPAMLDPAWQETLKRAFFEDLYHPTQSKLVQTESFPEQVDLAEHGPYANYNWELLFHLPLTIAVHLSKNQRFAEAQRWFHYIFDPTSNDQSIDPPGRFWRFLAFRQDNDATQIDELLTLLSRPASELSATDRQLQASILDGYQAILKKPFQPHAVARTRHLAYQYCVVMMYLKNLIAWGDFLFQQDTVESINEATQRYLLAANLLGPRPERVPPRGVAQQKTFAQLKQAGLDAMGNALVELEGQFPFNLAAPTAGGPGSSNGEGDSAGVLFGIGRSLYFSIPRNDKLLGYWDTVADRLFKIRHCMTIQGVVRPLDHFGAPIDPGMLVKAAAAGIDISSIVSGLNQPVGPVRCLVLIQKALEICNEVRGLGGELLAALEKGDGERMALIRQGHEVQLQQMAQEVRYLQWKQAQEATRSLLTSRATGLERLRYYQRLLGLPDDPNAPDALSLDRRELTEENFDEAYSALVDQYDVEPPHEKALALQSLPDLKHAGDSSPGILSGFSGSGKVYLSANEDKELNDLLPQARNLRIGALALNTLAASLTPVPSINVHGHFWGIGPSSKITGGDRLAAVARFVADGLQMLAAWQQDQAGMTSHYAAYERRADDWLLQHNLAAHELMQIGRQILTSLIAEQITHHEYQNAQQQVANAREVDQFLHDKFTDEELHGWMQGELSRLYYEHYRLAFDTARKAEKALKQELMRPELDAQDFVKFNYWDGGRKGLLSGEALYLDVRRMEMAYHDSNKRELELTRHVSLRQLDPLALLTLKASGTCQIAIPEWLFDRDCPGHYLRRIKSVALSIPSVVGPFASVNCTLTLLSSSVRKSPVAGDDYARQGAQDDRFLDYTAGAQSIVTSGASNDSGLFETNLRDERFLPFEGAGAVSTWKLELPTDYPAFDYATISDVIVHLRYTARQGVDADKVKAALDSQFQQADQATFALLLSLRHDFPTEWAAFVNGSGDFTATIRGDYFPYFTQGKSITITGLELYGQDIGTLRHRPVDNPDPGAATDDLSSQGQFTVSAAPDPAGSPQVLMRAPNSQVFLIVCYSLQ